MAGQGPAPKRNVRNARPGVDVLVADGGVRGPLLPDDALPEDEYWHLRTVAWWETWRASAQAATWTATDWDFLLDTALMHHVMWSKGKWEFASELRLRVAKFGATPEDRARLRFEVETVAGPAPKRRRAPAPSQSVTDIASRRARLTG